jgi:hypothetical protein
MRTIHLLFVCIILVFIFSRVFPDQFVSWFPESVVYTLYGHFSYYDTLGSFVFGALSYNLFAIVNQLYLHGRQNASIGTNVFLALYFSMCHYVLSGVSSSSSDTATEPTGAATEVPFPIDVVFTWAGEDFKGNKGDKLRTAYNGELKYALRGIVHFMPWVRRIHILRNPPKEIPSWFKYKTLEDLAKHGVGTPGISIVDHDETFPNPETELPSTHSCAIEFTMANIPGLADHFIYFNDDFIPLKPVPYTEYFTPEGKAVLSIDVERARQMESTTLQFNLPPHVPGFYPHIPLPVHKPTMENFIEEYADYVGWVRGKQSRKRLGCSLCTSNGMGCPCMQVQGTLGPYMLEKGMAVTKPYLSSRTPGALTNGSKTRSHRSCSTTYITRKCPEFMMLLANQPRDKRPAIVTINDTAETDEQREKMKKQMDVFFERVLPDKTWFE